MLRIQLQQAVGKGPGGPQHDEQQHHGKPALITLVQQSALQLRIRVIDFPRAGGQCQVICPQCITEIEPTRFHVSAFTVATVLCHQRLEVTATKAEQQHQRREQYPGQAEQQRCQRGQQQAQNQRGQQHHQHQLHRIQQPMRCNSLAVVLPPAVAMQPGLGAAKLSQRQRKDQGEKGHAVSPADARLAR